jgi:hypothetical protein
MGVDMKMKLMLLSVCMFGGLSSLLATDPVEKSAEQTTEVAASDEKSSATTADSDSSKDSKEEKSSSCTKGN